VRALICAGVVFGEGFLHIILAICGVFKQGVNPSLVVPVSIIRRHLLQPSYLHWKF
jgi:hypothetical protein